MEACQAGQAPDDRFTSKSLFQLKQRNRFSEFEPDERLNGKYTICSLANLNRNPNFVRQVYGTKGAVVEPANARHLIGVVERINLQESVSGPQPFRSQPSLTKHRLRYVIELPKRYTGCVR